MITLEARETSSRAYRVIGRYRVYSELASGGMATVHLGCMLGPAGFSKLVAIKCLHAQFALEAEFVAMFLDEARLTSSIHHPNVVASLDVVAEEDELLVVMEYIHGETLAALLRNSRQAGELPPLQVVTRVVCDALEGLHAAHVASLAGHCLNIVHRDVSPQNIMVGADGNSRVLDFGIAQAAIRSGVTSSGTVKGKIAYMSPEQAQNQAVDARTDIFAAGVVLWEALTGKRLFAARDPRETVSRLLNSTISPPSAVIPSLPSEIDRVVLKALARDPGQRFQSAHDFAEALRTATTEGSRRAVSDWVGRVAKGSLARRLELLETLEASAIHAQEHAVLPFVARSAPVHLPLQVGEITDAQTATTRDVGSSRNRTRRSPGPLAAAIGGIVAVMVAWAVVARHPPPQAAVLGPESTALAAAPVADRSAVPSGSPAAFQVESLPVAVPGSSGAPIQVQSLPLAAPSGEHAKRTPNKPRSVSEVDARPAPPKTGCAPPYRIDAAGVRRVKRECL